MQTILHNGKLVPKEQTVLPVTNKAAFFGFSVYESLKVVGGRPFAADYHVERLFQSARAIGLEHAFEKSQVTQWIDKLIHVNTLSDALIRIQLLGAGSRDEQPQMFLFPVGLTFYDKKLYRDGCTVITYRGERFLPQAKSNNLLLNFLAYREAQKVGALDALLVDHNGALREGTRTNIFALRGKELVTAPDEMILDGITRKLVLACAQKDFHIVQTPIMQKDLPTYDAFFLTSTTMNIMPIRQIDNFCITHPVPETLRTLMQTFRQFRSTIQ